MPRPRRAGFNERDDDLEPLSLAEELAEEADRGGPPAEEADDRYEKIKQGEVHIAELQR